MVGGELVREWGGGGGAGMGVVVILGLRGGFNIAGSGVEWCGPPRKGGVGWLVGWREEGKKSSF